MKRLLLGSLVLLISLNLVHAQDINSSSPNYARVDSIALCDRLETTPALASGPESEAGGRSPVPTDREGETKGRFWVSAEYLLWRMKKDDLPPLITVGPASHAGNSAILGQPGTTIVLGGKLNRGKFPGGRFTVGMWFNEKRKVGVELVYFFLKEKTFNFQVSSSGLPGSLAISRPFFDSLQNQERVFSVADPTVFQQTIPPIAQAGSSSAVLPNRFLGAESNLIYRFNESRFGQMSLLAGFRYLNLREGLTIIDVTDVSNGIHRTDTDQFSTRNQFYGGQVGARSSFSRHRLSLKVDARVAMGSNRQSVEINGVSSSDTRFITSNARGGVLALVSNIGQYRRNEFTVVPEAKAQLAYKFARYLHAFIGYGFLYWNKIVRPGDQIDRSVIGFLIPNLGGGNSAGILIPLRPVFTFNDASFWAQGLNIGIQMRF